MKTAFALLALLLPAAPAPEIDVQLKTVDGEVVCTVHTRGAKPGDVLAEIARKSERVLVGPDENDAADLIPVWLDERPLSYVVQTIAACAGWRAHLNISRITLEPDLGRGDDARAFEEQCFASTLRAIRAHPDHPRAAEGGMVLATIHEKHGDLRRAESEYTAVATRFPGSKEAPAALLHSGLIDERMGDWNAAKLQFSTLANLPQEHPYQARARLEIAHCMAESGDGRQALFVLDSMDKIFPTSLSSERQSRLYVRARALLAARREGEAAKALSLADELGRNEEWDADAMELRAQVLAQFGRSAESARAWLALAQKSEGQEQQRAWIQAAQQSMQAGDSLGVLAVQRLAAGTHAATAIEPLAESSRKDLGLDSTDLHGLGGDPLAQARLLLLQEHQRQALTLLEPLYQRREERSADERLELVTLYARALAGAKTVDDAVAELRRNLDTFPEPAARKLLCSTAGELYEAAERYDDAVRAFGGQL
ncbi:MAG: hypothetical protein IPJ19_05595 [Planctomycetes bacterium]|nr:hypothetical protein [Planctomycetota bacterium]